MSFVRRVILTPNPYRDKNFQTVRNAVEILEECGIETKLCLPFEVDKTFELPKDLVFHKLEKELPGADLVICFGGDGTILHMAKAATKHTIPILGVNIGTMGFMAELESNEMDKLRQIATGEYKIDRRMMLDVMVRRDKDILYRDICLNDIAITKGAVARIVHLSVRCDGVQAMECGGDGIIIATPTGSTAYNLSAGGPIVEPEAKNMMITPICAHDMVSRCIVTSDKRVITVALVRNARRNAYLSVDGGKAIHINMGDITTIRKSNMETKLLRLKERSFFDVLNAKFNCN